MTALEAIQEFDTLRPNGFSQEQKLRWLDRLDGFLQETVLDRYPGKAGTVQEGEIRRELVLPDPFAEAYLYWLEAKVHYYNQETDRYNSASGMFRGVLEDFQRELHRRETMEPGKDFRL